jgi:hypothetical protein
MIQHMLNQGGGESEIARRLKPDHPEVTRDKVRTIRLHMEGRNSRSPKGTRDTRPFGDRRRGWYAVQGWWYCPAADTFHIDNGDPEEPFYGICECDIHWQAAVYRPPIAPPSVGVVDAEP